MEEVGETGWEQRPFEASTPTAAALAALAQLAMSPQQLQLQDPALLAALLHTQPHAMLGVAGAAAAGMPRNLLPPAAGQPVAAPLLLPLFPTAGPTEWSGCEEGQQDTAPCLPPLDDLLRSLYSDLQ